MANSFALNSRVRALLVLALSGSFCGVSFAAPSILFTWADRVMIRDATGIVRVLDKPYGLAVKGITPGGHVLLEGGMRIGIGTKATAAFDLYKMAQKSNVVKAVKPFAKRFGPIAIASLTLDGLEWIDSKWKKREDVDWTIYESEHTVGWGCALGKVGAVAYTTFQHIGKVEVKIVNYGFPIDNVVWKFSNNCTDLPPVGGRFPHAVYRIVEKFPDIEDIPWRDATDSEIENAISDAVGDDGNKLVQPIEFGFSRGMDSEDLSPEDAPGHDHIEGPTSVEGPTTTTTTTGPGGTTTTTTNTTYNISTTNNTINITSTTTTITNKPDGTTETTESTTTTSDNDGGGDDSNPKKPGESGGMDKPSEQVGLCAQYPDILACTKLGDLSPVDIPSDTPEFSILEQSGFGPSTGVCPAPIVVSYLGKQLQFKFDLICQFATGIRPLLLAFAWLSAGLIFIGAVRRG